jgi:hypothetical protein
MQPRPAESAPQLRETIEQNLDVHNPAVLIDTYLEQAEDCRGLYGINGALVAVVECNPEGEDDGDDFYVFDLGSARTGFVDMDEEMAVDPDKRYVVMTGAFIDGRTGDAEPADNVSEGHGWRSFGDSTVFIGRSKAAEHMFGTTFAETTSPEHFQLSFNDDSVMVGDLLSANQTRVVYGNQPRPAYELVQPEQPLTDEPVQPEAPEAEAAPALDWGILDGGVPAVTESVPEPAPVAKVETTEERALRELQEAIPDYGKEFEINGTTFRYVGAAFRGHAFRSVGAQGQERIFFVYHSRSEGGWRVSQGQETDANGSRYLKGAERSVQHQYTQDTQLHPEFEKQVLPIVQRDSMPQDAPQTYYDQRARNGWAMNLDDQAAEKAKLDFEEQIASVRLGSRQLNHLLTAVGVDSIDAGVMRVILGMDEYATQREVWNTYAEQIEKINIMLEREKLIPDFTSLPVARHMDEHPRLGTTLTEVFEKTDAYGTTYEWHMSHDNLGRAWVSRIRLKDSEATPYGTDAQVVMSGVLTVKPVEYTNQADGLPEGMVKAIDGHYSDISMFGNMLDPVRLYKQAYPERGTLATWGPQATS